MPVGSGINAQFGGLKESVYGTPVTVTKFVEMVDESIQLNLDRIESKSLRSGSRVQRSTRWIANKMGASGDVTFEVQTKGMGWLFELAFGQGAVTTPGGGTLTRDQTFKLSDTPPSATLQVGRPKVDNTVQAFTYSGCMCTNWELACDVDGLLMFTLGIDAQDESTATALATASYPTSITLLSYLGGQIQLGGVNYDVKKFSVKGDNGLALDRRFIRNSGLKKQPIPADFTEIDVEFTVEFADLVAYNLFTAGTLGTFSAAFTGPLIETTLSYGATFTAPIIRIDGATPTVSGPDILELDIKARILHDPAVSADPITFVYRTVDTTI